MSGAHLQIVHVRLPIAQRPPQLHIRLQEHLQAMKHSDIRPEIPFHLCASPSICTLRQRHSFLHRDPRCTRDLHGA